MAIKCLISSPVFSSLAQNDADGDEDADADAVGVDDVSDRLFERRPKISGRKIFGENLKFFNSLNNYLTWCRDVINLFSCLWHSDVKKLARFLQNFFCLLQGFVHKCDLDLAILPSDAISIEILPSFQIAIAGDSDNM